MSYALTPPTTISDQFNKACSLIHDIWTKDHLRLFGLSWNARMKLKRALFILEECLTVEPEYWPAHFLIGKTYQKLHKHHKAHTWFQKALQLDNQQYFLHLEFGRESAETKQLDDILNIGLKAIELAPETPECYQYHALFCLMHGDTKNARLAITQSHRLNSQNELNQKIGEIVVLLEDGDIYTPDAFEAFGKLANLVPLKEQNGTYYIWEQVNLNEKHPFTRSIDDIFRL